MNDMKAPPPAEASLKYMAWDVKDIAKNIKRMADALEGIIKNMKPIDTEQDLGF